MKKRTKIKLIAYSIFIAIIIAGASINSFVTGESYILGYAVGSLALSVLYAKDHFLNNCE